MRQLILFLTLCVVVTFMGCRSGTVLTADSTDQQAKRTADTVRGICQYPCYDPGQDMQKYRTIIAAIIINRNEVEQSEEFRSRLIKVLTDTGISIEFADSITKTIVYGYVPTPEGGSFAVYLGRLLFHLDNRQWIYDPYSNVSIKHRTEKRVQ